MYEFYGTSIKVLPMVENIYGQLEKDTVLELMYL